jgi:hypothetical protein
LLSRNSTQSCCRHFSTGEWDQSARLK